MGGYVNYDSLFAVYSYDLATKKVTAVDGYSKVYNATHNTLIATEMNDTYEMESLDIDTENDFDKARRCLLNNVE